MVGRASGIETTSSPHKRKSENENLFLLNPVLIATITIIVSIIIQRIKRKITIQTKGKPLTRAANRLRNDHDINLRLVRFHLHSLPRHPLRLRHHLRHVIDFLIVLFNAIYDVGSLCVALFRFFVVRSASLSLLIRRTEFEQSQ